jgi:Domain of unknown function (DUF4910)/winged helix-turn-helix
MTYKQSRRGNAAIEHVLRHDDVAHRIRPFIPYGYDERQYCSPGFDLPVGSLMRTPNGEYPEYHSSGDNLSLLRPECFGHSLAVLRRIVAVIEGNEIYRNRNPKGEPQLGRRGLYATMGGQRTASYDQMALLWVLNLADGRVSLLETAERASVPFAAIRAAADALLVTNLLEPAAVQPSALVRVDKAKENHREIQASSSSCAARRHAAVRCAGQPGAGTISVSKALDSSARAQSATHSKGLPFRFPETGVPP